MTLLYKILGNAVSEDIEKVREKLDEIFMKDERLEFVFKVIRDMLLITDKRIIFVHYYGITGRKSKFKVIPHKSVNYFTVETGGRIDLDFELKIWVKGRSEPISTEMKKDRKLANELVKVLSKYVTQ